jgi:hypothetical protein
MASDDFVDSASFRDPSGHVCRIDGRIYRTVIDRAQDDFEAPRREARAVLEHPPLPSAWAPMPRSSASRRLTNAN